MKGIITGVADMRRRPKFRSERVSQLIFGEPVKVLGREEGYLKVAGVDRLEGYVLRSLVGDLEGERRYKLGAHHSGEGVQLPFGSYLGERDVARHHVPKKLAVPVETSFDPADLSERFLGVPYLWGGTSDFGYDCSGFAQRLYRFAGVELPRNSNWQRDAGERVKDFPHARRGDLVFFPGHVGLLLGGKSIIHANVSHGGVSVTDLSDGSEYSRSLLAECQGIRRFSEGSGRAYV